MKSTGKRVAIAVLMVWVALAPFLAVDFVGEVQALSDETTGLDFSSTDSTWSNYVQMGGYSIYCTNDEILFYEDDLTLKTFSFPTILGDEWHCSAISQYNSTHIIAGVNSLHTSVSNNDAWFQYWIINVASLGYSYQYSNYYRDHGAYQNRQNAYGDFCFVECDGQWYALVGGAVYNSYVPRHYFYFFEIHDDYFVKTDWTYPPEEYLYGNTWGFSSEEDADQAYVFSRSSTTSEQYRIFLFDADALTLSIVGTGTNGYCSDFNMVFGYFTHSIYGNLYYDFLMAYPDLNDIETLYLEYLRFNSTYLDETRVELNVDSSVDEVRPFSILSPDGVTGEDDLTDGYYSVVFVGSSYDLEQIVVAVTGLTTLTPELDIASGQFAYQAMTHYYEEDNIGGWQHTTSVVGTFFDYDNGDAIADNFDADEIPTPPSSYTATVASVPEIFVDFLVDEDTYQTPDEVADLVGTYIFTAEHAWINDSQGYVFDHWLVNGEDEYTTESIIASIYDDISLDIYYETAELAYANVSSSPEIGAYFYVDDDYYTTPEDVLVVESANYTFTAQSSKVVGEAGYVFDQWLINGTDPYETLSIELNITAATTLVINYTEGPVYYCNFSSSPEIASAFWVDTATYNTPETVVVTTGSHDFTSESAKIYGDTAYEFNYWYVNGTTEYEDTAIELSISGNTTLTAYFTEVDSLYTLYGVYNETTGLWMKTNCTVTVYFAEAQANHEFVLNGSYHYVPDYEVRYFHFDLGSYDREYWVGPEEVTATIYVFNDTLTGYTINFMDHAGILKTNQYVEAKFYVNGTLFTVDKRKVDVQNSIAMSLVNTRKYQLVISGEVTYTYGDLLMTDSTSVQLVLRGIDFPKETLLVYRYVRVYGVRSFDTPTGSITIWFQDVNNHTESVDITINYKNGTEAFSADEDSQYFSLIWNSAVNATDYALVVTINHETYGTYSYKQYFVGEFGVADPPFSLAWLGASFAFDSAYILPALLIVFVAACFSVLNAEVGAVLSVIIAILLTALGFIPIGTGFLVTAFALAILMGLSYAKRKVMVG